MRSKERVGGVCAAALTPLTEGLVPDGPALAEHCRRLLGSGCDAINLLGTTGEATSLAREARLAAMQAVAGAGLPLERFLVGTGAAAFADAVVLTRSAVALGFSGALVIPPFYFKNIVDDGIFRYYSDLIAAVDDARLRLYLYHFPQLSGIAFSPEIVARLRAAFPQTIVGLKDSSGSVGYAESIVAAVPEIDVFPSSEAALPDARAKGFAGIISATLNVDAPLAGRVWRGASDADGLVAIRTRIAQHQLVPAVRAVMVSLTGDEHWSRVIPPLIPLAADAAASLIADLDALPAFATVREAFACV